ncbi:rhodanese-like domain-containing protein [Pontitalea aquivivens]|uniref:rhodanese-like domain-containing protein n=1 Tax=Pontitalea aquivivens TaxID=3388663 RepID=UPI00397099D2
MKGFDMLNFLRPSFARTDRIAPQEAVRQVAAGDMTLIDVREVAELRASGKAAGALHVPLMALRMKCDPASPECLPGLSVDKPVALYCASGGRSAGAAQMLAQMGYKTVYNLGGLHDWHAAGGAIER